MDFAYPLEFFTGPAGTWTCEWSVIYLFIPFFHAYAERRR